jgi:hypothetical protein
VLVSCELSKNKKDITCTTTPIGASTARITSTVKVAGRSARATRRGTVRVRLHLKRKLRGSRRVAVQVKSGRSTGRVKTRLGKRTRVTLKARR